MYEIFEQLLQIFGVTTYQVSKATGIPQSTFSAWKKRRNIISGELAKKIADYFGVTVDYLMTGVSTSSEPYYNDPESREIANFLFKNPQYRTLFSAARDVSPEDLELARQFLDRLKKKENQ